MPLGSGLHVCRTRERVDGDRVHPAGGDEDTAGRGRRDAVAGRLDGDRERLPGGEGHRGGHVPGRLRGDDHVGPVLPDPVEPRELPLVPRVLRSEDLTLEPCDEPVHGALGDARVSRLSCHDHVLPPVPRGGPAWRGGDEEQCSRPTGPLPSPA